MSILNFSPVVPGRQVDLLVLHVSQPFKLTTAEQSLRIAEGGKACLGLQKLAQSVMMRLYTATDGQLYADNIGNSFADMVRQGVVRNVDDIRQEVASAIRTVMGQFYLDRLRDPTIPLDELPEAIELLSATVSGDTLSLTISILSMAGSAAEFIFPVTVTS